MMTRHEAIVCAEQKHAIADYMVNIHMTAFDVSLVRDMLLVSLSYISGYSGFTPLLKKQIVNMPMTHASAVNCVRIVNVLIQNLK